MTFYRRVWHWACQVQDAPGFFPLPWVCNSLNYQSIPLPKSISNSLQQNSALSFTNCQRLRTWDWDMARFRYLLITHTAEPSPWEDPSRNKSPRSTTTNFSPHIIFFFLILSLKIFIGLQQIILSLNWVFFFLNSQYTEWGNWSARKSCTSPTSPTLYQTLHISLLNFCQELVSVRSPFCSIFVWIELSLSSLIVSWSKSPKSWQ